MEVSICLDMVLKVSLDSYEILDNFKKLVLTIELEILHSKLILYLHSNI